jgi:acyl-coenzyme A synthetase/AMP-(fatty) acid ligase
VRGYRVELGEIEAVLAGDDAVAEAVVVALPDPEHGAVLVGAVIPTPGARIEERDLRKACSARLPHYMVPASIAIRDAFPRTSSGKIDRLRLTEELASPAPTPRGS